MLLLLVSRMQSPFSYASTPLSTAFLVLPLAAVVLAHIFCLRFAGRDEHIIYFGQDVLACPMCACLCVPVCLCVCMPVVCVCVCLIAGCQRLRDKLTARNIRATRRLLLLPLLLPLLLFSTPSHPAASAPLPRVASRMCE